jgi:hypothetical protein
MESNVNFKFLYADLESYVDGETSRHGAEMSTEDGKSLYDVLKVHTNDLPTIRGYVADAIRTIETNMGEDAVVSSVVEDSDVNKIPIGVVLRFYVPDADRGAVPQAKHEIGRFITLFCTAKWIERKGFVQHAQPLMAAAVDSMTRGITILRTRRRPSRNDL